MTPAERRELVARAIALEMDADPDVGVLIRGRTVPFWRTSPLAFADAAIKATLESLLEPTDEMIIAGADAWTLGTLWQRTGWAAMIRSAMGDTPENPE